MQGQAAVGRGPIWVGVGLAGLALSAGHSEPVGRPTAGAAPTVAAPMAAAPLPVPLTFEKNAGQADPGVRFLCRGNGSALYLKPTEAVLALAGPPQAETGRETRGRRPGHVSAEEYWKQGSREALRPVPVKRDWSLLRMRLRGANPQANPIGGTKLPTRLNYLVGRRDQWRTGVETFADVRYPEVYPGIDLVYYGTGGALEHDFIVQPGADPSDIQIEAEGAEQAHLEPNGDLIFTTAAGEVRQQKPQVYQEREGQRLSVVGEYVLQASPENLGNTDGERTRITFRLGAYDPELPLVIDPVLDYSSYFNGKVGRSPRAAGGQAAAAFSPLENASEVAVDGAGNTYLAGTTTSAGLTTTPGAAQPRPRGGNDVFVAKLAADRRTLLYATYLGGSLEEEVQGMAVDSAGGVYLTGSTDSDNFPVAANALQTTPDPFGNAFVARLNPAGTQLVYSTYLGGENQDTGLGIAVDSAQNAYVTGFTESPDFPVTAGAAQTVYREGNDAFVTKVNPTGTALVYSTLLGGTNEDTAYGITVDGDGQAFVTGDTASSNFPITPGAAQANLAGVADAFVAGLQPDGATFTYVSYLGGAQADRGEKIGVCRDGCLYLTGSTQSVDFPVTPNAQQTQYGQNTDAFIVRLDPSGGSVQYATYLGGAGGDFGFGLAVQPDGTAYVTGQASSTLPLVNGVNGLPARGGEDDLFVARIRPTDGTSALEDGDTPAVRFDYVVSVGGSGSEFGRSLALSPAGDPRVTGGTASTNFPTTPAALQNRIIGPENAYLTEVRSGGELPVRPTNLRTVAVSPSGVDLAWEDRSGNELFFLVERRAGEGPYRSLKQFGADITSYADRSLLPNTPYSYRVQAINLAGQSEFSNTSEVTTPDGPAPAGKLSVSTSTLKFKSTKLQRTSIKVLKVKNTGTGPLTLVAGSPAAPFRVEGDPGAQQILPGKTLSLRLAFTPVATGTFPGALSLTCNDPARATVLVPLSGTAK